MKKITLWLFALFTCWQITAQTTVTIGTGTSASGTGINASPIYRSSAGSAFNYSQSVELLTSADLSAVGITAGSTITKIAYKKLDTNTLSAGRTATMNIYLKNSAATVLNGTTPMSTYISGATQCYTNAVFSSTEIPGVAGWVEFVFSTPFNYTGGSIEVAIDWAINAGAGNPTTGGFSWEYTAAAAVQAAGTSNSVAITGNLTTTASRQYNTQLTYTNSPCTGTPAPGNTTFPASFCAGSSVTLGLQNATIGSGVTYQWYMDAAPIALANNPTYTISSVTSSHTYYCEVTCAGNTGTSSSVVVGPTIPVAPTAVEPFNTFLPSCWLFGDNGDITAGPATFGANSWKNDGFANSGATGSIAYNHYTTGANDWIISPIINVPATGYEIKFDAALTQWNGTGAPTTPWDAGDVVEVLVSTSGLNNWIVLYTIDNATNIPSASGSSVAIDLDAYAAQNIRVAFRVVSGPTDGGDDTDIFIDNFQVRLSPTCPDQTGLVASNITAFTADTSWDDMSANGAVGYEYAVNTSATPPASGTPTAATFYAAAGLSAQTVYYLHVRSECSGSTYGNWSTISFTTGCAPITALPHLEPFNTFLPNACWMNGVNGDLTAGPAAFTASGWGADGLANAGTTGAIRNNIYMTGANDWVISPQFTIPATGYELKFVAAAVQFAGTGAPTTPWESDDFVEVLVSSTGTTNWTVLHTYNDTNQPGITATSLSLDLDAYSGQTVRFAFRAVEGATDGAADIDFSIDNFEVRLSPVCPDQTGLVVSNVGAFTADTSWDDMSAGGSIGYEYAVNTSATPPASGTPTTNTFYIASGLAPQTVHYLHVRSECSGSTYGNWSTISFTTLCAPVASLPWIETFESVTTPALPQCWLEQNGDWETSNATTYNNAHGGTKYLRDAWSATNEFMWTPGFDLVGGTSYDFSSWVQGDGYTGWTVDYFVNSTQNSSGATQLGAQYAVPGSGTIAIQPYAQVTRSFVPATSGTYYFAFRVNQSSATPWYVAVDDVELKLSPTLPPACATNLVATPNACGNFANNLNWDATPSANGYYVTIGTTSGGTDIANAVNVGSNTYSFTGTINTTYFWTVVPYNGAGSATGCTEQSFTTAATGCYCTSNPTSNDGLGITTAVVGATSNPIADVTYVNLTAAPEVVAQGANTNVQLTFSTGYTYDINIWIDFNNDYDFNDVGELVKTGIACTAATPNTVDASFTMPLTAPTGPHRMRIGTADVGQVPPNPCYGGTYGVTLDFVVDTVLSSNSFDSSNFVAYPNPVKDILNLSYKNVISNVRVINLLGQEVLRTNVNTNDVQVNMSSLSAGAYIVNITSDDVVHTIKVIKE